LADRQFVEQAPKATYYAQFSGASSLRAIAQGLNDQGIPTARGGTWAAPQVMHVLRRA
jgi:hypothetical protein